MDTNSLCAVTGAFGFTGKYITQRLLNDGNKVITLTGHPERDNPFGDQVRAFPFNFDNPSELTRSLEGVDTLYCTYWIRFDHGHMTYDKAVENTKTLVTAAKDAGVRRFVYVSITNPSEKSPFPYFRGKGILESFIRQSGISYAIVRPTVIFGKEDILINNIAWILRKAPMFAIPGSGDYKLQPVFVEDMAEITIRTGMRDDNINIDAVGPEIFTFNELVHLIAEIVGSKTRITHVNPGLALFFAGLVGKALDDVLLTEDEVKGLMANLLVSDQAPTGRTLLSEWLRHNADTVGMHYASELSRHYH
jgi:NADH dehydrogenase